jgi:hypothetical protein
MVDVLGTLITLDPLPQEFLRMIPELKYLPFPVRARAILRGYAATFKLCAVALDHPSFNPTGYRERHDVPLDDPRGAVDHLVVIRGAGQLHPSDARDLQAYISACGGSESATLYALDCLVGMTHSMDPPHVASGGDPDLVATWDALPRCANDEDFALARSRLGLAVDTVWGPYTAERKPGTHRAPPPPSNFFESLASETKPGEPVTINCDDVDISRVPIPIPMGGGDEGCLIF